MLTHEEPVSRQLVERLNQGWQRQTGWFRKMLVIKFLILVAFTFVISIPNWLTCTAVQNGEEEGGEGEEVNVSVTVGLWRCEADGNVSRGRLAKNDSFCQEVLSNDRMVCSQVLNGIAYVATVISFLLEVSRICHDELPDNLTDLAHGAALIGGVLGFIASWVYVSLKGDMEEMPDVKNVELTWGTCINSVFQMVYFVAVSYLMKNRKNVLPRNSSPSGGGGDGGGDGASSSEDTQLSSEDGLHELPPSYEDVVNQPPSYETAVMQRPSAQAGENPSSPPEVNREQPPAYEAGGDQLSPLEANGDQSSLPEASGDQSSLPEASGDQHSSAETSRNQTAAEFGGDQMSPSESDGDQTSSSEVSDGIASSTGAGADQQLSSESSVDQTSHSEAVSHQPASSGAVSGQLSSSEDSGKETSPSESGGDV